MRWVDIKNGIKQRINEILGTSDNAGSGNDLTTWSIQSAMLTNLKRIVSSMVGEASYGRPMRGLWMSKSNATTFTISSGFGFTVNGEIISLTKDLSVPVDPGNASATLYITLNYSSGVITESSKGGKNTDLIGGGNADIINDDVGSVNGNDITPTSGDLGNFVTQSTSLSSTSSDQVYLGSITLDGSGEIVSNDSISNTAHRGLPPNTSGSAVSYLPTTRVKTNLYVESYIYSNYIKALDGSASSTVTVGSKMSFSEDISVSDDKLLQLPSGVSKVKVGASGSNYGVNDKTETGVTDFDITIKNGIITSFTKN